eukprot:874746-Heterocapsa_arctica.AAC.1
MGQPWRSRTAAGPCGRSSACPSRRASPAPPDGAERLGRHLMVPAAGWGQILMYIIILYRPSARPSRTSPPGAATAA